MNKPFGMSQCDFCKGEEGEFDTETDNHDACVVLDLGKRMRNAQKEFYLRRKTATTAERNMLLQLSIKLEREFDKAVAEFFAQSSSL